MSINLLMSIIFLGIIGYIAYKNNKQKKSNKNLQEKAQKQEKNETLPYKLNENIFTKTERFFYKILKEITYGENIAIMTKVRLADIIYTNEYNYKYFNKIKAKHIDFVLIDNDGKIKLLIELDDKSHENYERKIRDDFINEIFKNLNVNLLRIPVKPIYNIEELQKQIIESIK